MKKNLKGKVYDTQTADKVGEWDNGHFTRTRINWTLDTDIVEDLRQRTAETGVPVSRAVSDVLRAAGYGKK